MRLGVLLEPGQPGLGVVAERRQVAAVAAQGRGQQVDALGPQPAAAGVREPLRAHADQEHRVPLQPLGAVDGQQLHRVGLAGGRDVESLAEVVLRLEPGQQRGEADRPVDGLEVRDRLDEQVEVLPPGAPGLAHRGGELHVEPAGVDDAPHQLEQRLPGVAAQVAQLGGQQGEPLPRRRRVGQVAGVVQRVGQRDQLGGVGPGHRARQLLVEGQAGPAAAPGLGELAGARPEQGQVPRADRPPRAGQQGQQLGVGGEVVDQGEGGQHLGDLREPQQPRETDDLDGHPGGGQRVEDVGRVGVVTDQDADLAPRRCLHRDVRGRDLLGQPRELGGRGEVDDRVDRPVVVGAGLERVDLGEGVVQRGGERVGDLEDAPVRPPVDRQRVAGDLPAGRREVLAEVQDVGHRGAAPPVDRLVGVADRGDRVPAAEQRAQHLRLGDGGVLVLVEQDHGVLVPLELADDRVLGGQLRGERDLVGEVHEAVRRLERAVLPDQRHRLRAPGERALHLGQRRGGVGQAGREELPLVRVEGGQVVGRDEVLRERAVELEDVVDDVLGAVGELVDAAGVPLDHPRGELVARGVGHHPGVGLVAQAQSVLGQQRRRVGVVRRDEGLEDVLGVGAARGGRAVTGGVERAADAQHQLVGRLRGEGQAEDLVGRHLPGGDEVDDPGRHHRGLARPGARDHHRRLERRRDRLPLLGADGEVGAHHRAQRLRGVDPGGDGRGHESTVPEFLAGQSRWKSQCSQWVPGRAGKDSVRSAPTASMSCRSIGRRPDSSGSCGSCRWTLSLR